MSFMTKINITEEYKNLAAVKDNVMENENIKNWVAKRPESVV